MLIESSDNGPNRAQNIQEVVNEEMMPDNSSAGWATGSQGVIRAESQGVMSSDAMTAVPQRY